MTACFALTLSGAALGRALAASRRLRVAQLEKTDAALCALREAMLKRLLPLKEALLSTGHPAFETLAGALSGGRSASSAWSESKRTLTSRGAPFSCFGAEEAAILDDFFEGLGGSGLSAQALLFEKTGAALRPLLESARKKAEEQAKLYGALGLLSGLSLSILLL